MKIVKKSLSLMLVLALLLAWMPVSVARAEENTPKVLFSDSTEGLEWVLTSDGTLTISGTGRMEYDTRPWEPYKAEIKKVVIKEGVTSIAGSAFYECANLTEVQFPDTLETINYDAFEDCISLTSITIPKGVTKIDASAFSGCTALKAIRVAADNSTYSSDDAGLLFNKDKTTLIECPEGFQGNYEIPSGVITIKGSAFANCYGLTDIVISDTITTVENYAFSYCKNLADVVISNSVTSIGSSAFENCDALAKVSIPGSVLSIGGSAFWDCDKLTSANIADGVASLGDSAFNDCDALTDVTLPNSLSVIGDYTFSNCDSLSAITIPKGITHIDSGAFSSCNELTEITFQGHAPAIDSNAFAYVTANAYYPQNDDTWTGEILNASYGSNASLTWIPYEKIQDPEEDTEIYVIARGTCGPNASWTLQTNGTLTVSGTGDMEFGMARSADIVPWADFRDQITSVVIKEGITSIADSAFSECQSLEGVSIGSTVTSVGDEAFARCDSLTEITFEGSAPEFGENCFEDVTATASYPADDDSWSEDALEGAGGDITLVADDETGHTHSYTSIVTEPTCTEKGYTTYTCACGDTYTADEVAALGHKYENGACTVCGETAPNYNEAITRLSGSNRYKTAFQVADAIKDVLGVETFDHIVVTYGRNFADALAGSYLANELDAPILLTEDSFQDDVIAYIAENLSENGKVYILGGTSSVSASFEKGLEDIGINRERLSGSNRYLTNLAILAEAGLNGSTILVCDGSNFADSLSASSLDLPILLVGDALSKDQKDYLETLEDVSFRFIGGPNSVSESIAEALKAYGTVDRISGSTREETSAKVAEIFCPDPNTVTLAYSRNFPDGLCGGPLAYQLGAPLLLVNSGAESFAADYVAENDITSGIILGGTNSVPDKVANTIFAK